jgi:uncharacterized peroxidase-related enzyme
MPRYLPIQADAAYDEIRAVYQDLRDQLGFVPNYLKTIAHSPNYLKAVAGLYTTILKSGELSPKLRALVMLKTSRVDRCKPSVAQFTQMALDAGWTEDHIKALDEIADSDLFSFYEKDVLQLVEEVLGRPDDISEPQFWTQLDNHFTSDQVVEMLTLIGFVNMVNRFILVVDVQPDPVVAPA